MTYINQIFLIPHMEIVDHRGLVQMSELRHIICLVEFGRVYFINGLGIDFSLLRSCQQSQQVQWSLQTSYTLVVTLYKQAASTKLLDYPSSHER